MPTHHTDEREAPAGLVGGAALLLTLGGVALWLAMLSGPLNLGTGLLEARTHLDRAQTKLSNGKFKGAVSETFDAKAGATRAQSGLDSNSPLMDLATLSPVVDDAVGELDHIIGAATHATDAALGTLDIGLGALDGPDAVVADDPDGEGSIVRIDRIEELGIVVEQVRADIVAAGDEFEAVNLGNLPRRLHGDINDGIEQAHETEELLDKAQSGFELLPGILGAEGPRTYMLGFQNSAELRGSGGAMLQFEFLTIDNGRVELSGDKTGSIYKLDQERRPIDIPLPEDAWYVEGILDAQRFGNSNWSPDWPLSAQLTTDYGEASSERCVPDGEKECPAFPDVDGVIAVDPVVVENLVPGIGPYQQGSFFIKQSTVVDILLNRAYQYFPIPSDRRGFLGKIVDKFFSRMFDPKSPTRLVEGMGRSLADKNMQIWMTEESEQAFIERMNWDGSLAPADESDYFQVVEQNVGGNKLDYSAAQTDELDITIEGSDAVHSTEVIIDNNVMLPEPRWFLGDSKSSHRPMLNFYVPPAAELLSAGAGDLCPAPLDRSCNGRIDAPPGLATWTGEVPPTHSEKSKKVWSATLQVPAGESGSFSVDYLSPGVVTERGGRSVYRLVVQRQAKFHPEELLIQLNLPEGATGIRAPGFSQDGRTLTYERPLTSDTELEVSWRS